MQETCGIIQTAIRNYSHHSFIKSLTCHEATVHALCISINLYDIDCYVLI